MRQFVRSFTDVQGLLCAYYASTIQKYVVITIEDLSYVLAKSIGAALFLH